MAFHPDPLFSALQRGDKGMETELKVRSRQSRGLDEDAEPAAPENKKKAGKKQSEDRPEAENEK